MNPNTEKAFQFTSPNVLLPTDPIVSVGIDVGEMLEEGQSFEVDYPSLRKTLQAVDAPEDNSTLGISFEADIGPPDYILGWYHEDGKQVYVKLHDDNKKTQAILQHELRHYTDALETPSTKNEKRKRVVASRAMSASTPLVATSVILQGVSLGGILFRGSAPDLIGPIQEVLGLTQITVSSLGVAALGVVGIAYTADKRERAARKAEKLEAPTVVSMPKATLI